MTREQFLTYWLHKHVPLGIPWALASNCESYFQIHAPRLSAAGRAAAAALEIDVEAFDGAAAMTFSPPPPPPTAGAGAEIAPGSEKHGSEMEGIPREQDDAAATALAAKCKSFFERVIVPDEAAFLSGPAREVVVFVDEWMVEGKRLDVIRDGKIAAEFEAEVDVKEAWRFWEEWDG